MSHDDGRCATDAETIYVQKVASCPGSAATADGSEAKPYCSMEPAVAAVGGASPKNLIVVRGTVTGATAGFNTGTRKVSIVGQMTGSIAGASDPAILLSIGDLFVRNVKVSSSASIGCQAITGSTLRLDHVLITANPGGGILLDGAGFEIQDTIITNNGPGLFNNVVDWGGIFVSNPPAAGPAKLQRLTVQNNMQGGIRCSTALTMTNGVLSSGNQSPDIHATCGFTSCGAASATCGAQP
jgi:hypothetical protein